MATKKNTHQTLVDMYRKIIDDNGTAQEDDNYSLVQPTPMKIIDSRTTDHTLLYDDQRVEFSA